ncbi:MAG: ABC transporter permease [Bacteroidales bacterium]|jgi:peptide/nickel transport system permease protein|nr:ABC transporter permease [Bacteroidales bacterium]
MSLFFQGKTHYKAQSLQSIAWRKFRKNTQGMILICFLGFVSIISLLGYLITPDHTPYANEQILQIRLQKPMSKITFLQVRKNYPIEKRNFFLKMLFGQPAFYTSVPVTSYSFSADSIFVELFNESPPYNRMQYSLADVVFPTEENISTEMIGENIVFTDIYHKQHSLPVDQLQAMAKENIITKTCYLGTDRYGRDVLSQLIIGARVSLSVGFVSVFIALIIGVFLGSIAGYFRGVTDDIIMWFINVVWSIPTLLLVIAISFALGTGFWQIFIAIGLTMWVDIARVVRGQVISLREKEFVEASKALGFKSFTIIFKHIIPNITGTIIVIVAANFASAILTEASLSFLGIGVQAPMPSWGTMIKENYGYIILDYAYLAVVPGVAIMLLVLCFMLMGNVLRDVMDVKDKGSQ